MRFEGEGKALSSSATGINRKSENEVICPISDSPLSEYFKKGMSPKKWHEVERLADLVYRTSLMTGCRNIVDLGCGQGYLMQVLAFYYRLQVLGVDSSSLQTRGAKRRAGAVQELLKTWGKKTPELGWEKLDLCPVFMTLDCPIDTHMTMAELYRRAKEAAKDNPLPPGQEGSEEKSNGIKTATPHVKAPREMDCRTPQTHPLLGEEGVIIVGLHTCGDLSPTALKLFHESDNVKAMINVGCCYNLMTEGSSALMEPSPSCSSSKGGVGGGYPLSKTAANNLPHLGRMARVLACQSMHKRPTVADRDGAIERVHRSQCFRAVLQVIYERELGVTENVYSGEYSPDYLETFPIYARHILQKVNISHSFADSDFEQFWEELGVPNYKSMIAFDNLRMCLAPVIESLIIEDRLEFLREAKRKSIECDNQNSEHQLVPLFDATVSPRNMALLSIKTTDQ